MSKLIQKNCIVNRRYKRVSFMNNPVSSSPISVSVHLVEGVNGLLNHDGHVVESLDVQGPPRFTLKK